VPQTHDDFPDWPTFTPAEFIQYTDSIPQILVAVCQFHHPQLRDKRPFLSDGIHVEILSLVEQLILSERCAEQPGTGYASTVDADIIICPIGRISTNTGNLVNRLGKLRSHLVVAIDGRLQQIVELLCGLPVLQVADCDEPTNSNDSDRRYELEVLGETDGVVQALQS
jgi:hypothetical protein